VAQRAQREHAMKVAIVHYWLTGMRGGEKVVEALCELFPGADIFTNVYVPERVSATIRRHRVRTTFVNRLPFAASARAYLALMPVALEQLDLRGYDLIISNESGPAKGVVPPLDAMHICYCLSPMRYAWDLYQDYLASSGPVARALMRPAMHYLRMWDLASAARVDHFATLSEHTRRRVAKYYRRDAEIIHPPVDTHRFSPRGERGDFYLVVGATEAYKRVDLAVEAFNRLGRPLVVIGEGPEDPRLRRLAGPNVTLLGAQPDEVLQRHYASCRALIFPGEEDFGIVPVECMASGRPIIAYGRGGVLDTIVDGETGVLFREQTVESLIDAVVRYERSEREFSPERLAEHARAFDREHFKARFGAMVERVMRGPAVRPPVGQTPLFLPAKAEDAQVKAR
jgi:glycosyltransferase involved in cell wall biosynthesis